MVAPPQSPTDEAQADGGAASRIENERLFNRPPRILRRLPHDEIVIPAPPQPAAAGMRVQLTMVLLPLLTSAMYLVVLLASGGQRGNIWLTLPVIGVSTLSAGFGIYNFVRQRRAQERLLQEQDQVYTTALDTISLQLQRLAQLQRQVREANDPSLDTLAQIVEGEQDPYGVPLPAPRLWERRPTDDDFLTVRIGRANLPTTVSIKPPQMNLLQFTPALRRALDLAAEFAVVHDVPFTVPLRSVGSLGVAGPSGKVLECTRALLWQIAVHHSPKDVRIVAFWDSRFDTSWEWLRWLPHTRPLDGSDDYRLLARFDGPQEPLQQVMAALVRELQQRAEQRDAALSRTQLVVVLADYQRYGRAMPLFAQVLRAGTAVRCTAICLVDEIRQVPGECGAYIDLGDTPTLAIAGAAGGRYPFIPQGIDRQLSSRLGRYLAPLAPAEADGRRELPRSVRLLPLLGIKDAKAYAPQELWRVLPDNNWHPIPCGLVDATEALEINLNEGFDGVHGMIAGTTGSGKSEFLLTFLLALAIKHSPDRVNFMLIDFKGGATFQGLEGLPHTAGVVTDLKGNMAERALIAINSELDRRKRRLAQASQWTAKADVPNIREYRKHGFEQHSDFGPMPNLLIAIDEFDEMVRDYPEFVTELVRVAKQGRSLGVHLLFATQQPSLIKEGLTRNLTYWIALRVTGTDDSKAMVTIPDAAYLTTETPGRGFFRVGKRVVQFQSARVTVPYQPPAQGSDMGYVDVTGRWQPIQRQHRGVVALRDTLCGLLSSMSEPRPTAVAELANEFLQTYQRLAQEGLLPAHAPSAPASHVVDAVAKGFQRHLAADMRDLSVNVKSEAEALVEQLLEIMQAEHAPEHDLGLITQAMINDPATGTGYAARRYPIWMEPLPADIALADLLGHNVLRGQPWLHAPIGMVDLPAEARQQPSVLDLAKQHGNILVLGSAGSGKTTFVRTLALSLAASHSPSDLWIYVIDPSGSGCGLATPLGIAGREGARALQLQQLADAFTPQQSSKLDRLLIELQDQIRQRQALLLRYGVDTLAELRQQPAYSVGALPPGIVLIVDNIAELAAAQPDCIDALKGLLRDARKCGITAVVTGYSWREVAPLQSNFETRLALRLNDPTDSDAAIGKPYAARIATDQPGRGFLRTSEGLVELQVALPNLSVSSVTPSASTATSGVHRHVTSDLEQAVQLVNERYRQVVDGLPQPLRSLPTRVELADLLNLPEAAPLYLGVPVAIDGMTFQPICLDFAATTPHLLIAGSPRSGKSTLLRTILTGLARRYTPNEVQFVLVDPRRRLLQLTSKLQHVRAISVAVPATAGAAPEQRLVKIITNEQEIRVLVADLVAELARRSVSTCPHPRIVLFINNWDLLQDTYSLWKPLGPFVMQGRDLGLHVVVTGAEYANFSSTDMLKMARLERCALYLGQPSENSSAPNTLGIKLPRQALQTPMPPGRGYFALHGQVQLVQCALASGLEQLTTTVETEHQLVRLPVEDHVVAQQANEEYRV